MDAPREDPARTTMHKLLAAMARAGGSDLFIAADYPPSMKAHGQMTPMAREKLGGEATARLADALMNDKQRAEFAREMECNFAINVPGVSRFRVNVYVQQGQVEPVTARSLIWIARWRALSRSMRSSACIISRFLWRAAGWIR